MRASFRNKRGFGIAEVLVAALVLGLMYMGVLHLQTSNREALIRIRGRDAAIEVAQQVLDSLKSVSIAAIPSYMDKDTTIILDDIQRSWDRKMGDKSTIAYSPVVTVAKTSDYVAKSESQFDTVQHVYAKQVNVSVSWQFKGSTQSINVSGVIR